MSDMTPEKAQALLDGATPGPWQFEYKNGNNRLLMNDNCQMCDETYYPWTPDRDDDWRIMSTAPDLARAYIAQAARIADLEAKLAEREAQVERLLAMQTDREVDHERQLAEAREVKPLEWWEAELPSRGGGKYKADGYTIRRIEGLWLLDFAGDSRSDWRFTSLQGAKDHAQFLHTARILSALKGTP